METEFRLPLCIFQNHSLSSMPVCFQLVSLIYAEVTARGRAGSVARWAVFLTQLDYFMRHKGSVARLGDFSRPIGLLLMTLGWKISNR